MRVYLDICCLKRPFDDQSQPRIRLETEAILSLIAALEPKSFLHAAAHDLENEQNPVGHRAAKVRSWLETIPLAALTDDLVKSRTNELMLLGFRNFDALHLASAESGQAQVFVTCDDRMQAAANRHSSVLNIRVVNPVDLVDELLS